jgi:hypothetical protein
VASRPPSTQWQSSLPVELLTRHLLTSQRTWADRQISNQRLLLPLCYIETPFTTCAYRTTMRTDSRQHLDSGSAEDRTYLESFIREDFERCHPGETLDDLKRRASFSKEDRGLLRDWMAVAAARAAAECTAEASPPLSTSEYAASADPPPGAAGSIEGSEPHHDPNSDG